MRETEKTPIEIRNQKVKRAAFSFFAGMVILAVLSNTINHLSLPRVRTEWSSKGSIINEIKVYGSIEAKKNYQFYAPMAMRVQKVNVHTDELVKKGQQIMMLDASSLKKQLLDETDRFEQKKINLELMKLKTGSEPDAYDGTIDLLKTQMERITSDYERMQALTEVGLETRENLKIVSRKLDDARMEYEKAISERDKALLTVMAEAQKNELETQNLLHDMEISKRGIEQLEKQIKECKLIAPFDGIISMNCSEGEVIGTSQPLYSMTDISGGYCFKGFLNKEQVDDIKPGDEAEVILDGQERQKIPCKVVELKDSREYPGERMEGELGIPPGQWIAGQKGSVKFVIRSAVYEFLVSNSAIGKDNKGYFVYIPEEKESYLGNEIYARLVRVTIGESDDEKTAIIQGLSKEDRVIGNSDKPLTDGIRIIWEQ